MITSSAPAFPTNLPVSRSLSITNFSKSSWRGFWEDRNPRWGEKKNKKKKICDLTADLQLGPTACEPQLCEASSWKNTSLQTPQPSLSQSFTSLKQPTAPTAASDCGKGDDEGLQELKLTHTLNHAMRAARAGAFQKLPSWHRPCCVVSRGQPSLERGAWGVVFHCTAFPH